MADHGHGDRARGFTLIELLIVITILAGLMAVLLPNLWGVSESTKETTTETTMLRLESGCRTFADKHGYFPPDDLRWPEPEKKAQWKSDNGQNTGIESLVCFLSQSRQDGQDLGDLTNQLVNTDKDDHGVDLPLLKRKDRVEIADAWGTPLAYFGKFGLDRQQTIAIDENETTVAKAKKRDDGRVFGEGRGQLLSAGRDRIFGTADDLVSPKN
ncbi:MAG: prepilin-type N-terminal cleavage/methylation domain-containing protein [Planctomycetes bacterium]|nr:prepilin-type N-terminal cleavage/methylation domain-containing protein [Planctomycetota bacterium]